MTKAHVIIFKLKNLYDILKEIEENLNFKIEYLDSLNEIKNLNNDHLNYLLLSNNSGVIKKTKLKTLIIEKKPNNLMKLVEQINILLLKNQFSEQSKIIIKGFTLDTNSRDLIKEGIKLKLTQKETEIIIYLNKSNKDISIQYLKKNVWGYIPTLETHTVETHIYRLRKKILNAFKSKEFITSTDHGYKI